jgi:hypothetical protein
METVYAIIKDGLVINTIVCEESFISTLQSLQGFDKAVRIDGCSRQPSIGWTHGLVDVEELGEVGVNKFENESETI